MAKAHPFVNTLKITEFKGIGRIIFSGALLEFAIAAILINALGINRKEGRAAIIPQTARANLDLLVLVAKARGVKGKELKIFRTLTADIAAYALHYRNLIAHGVWQYDQEARTIGVTSYRGGNRALLGDRILVKDKTLAGLDDTIKSWHWALLDWVKAQDALLFQLPDKSRRPCPEPIPSPAGNPITQPLRPRSSQAL